MRAYPKNSPQAAARIVALTVIADGDIRIQELQLLDSMRVHSALGLDREELLALIDIFCEDLLASNQLAWADACPVDAFTLGKIMGEVDEPDLRRRILGICAQLAACDGNVAEGETAVLKAAAEHWGMRYHLPVVHDTSALS